MLAVVVLEAVVVGGVVEVVVVGDAAEAVVAGFVVEVVVIVGGVVAVVGFGVPLVLLVELSGLGVMGASSGDSWALLSTIEV